MLTTPPALIAVIGPVEPAVLAAWVRHYRGWVCSGSFSPSTSPSTCPPGSGTNSRPPAVSSASVPHRHQHRPLARAHQHPAQRRTAAPGRAGLALACRCGRAPHVPTPRSKR